MLFLKKRKEKTKLQGNCARQKKGVLTCSMGILVHASQGHCPK